LEDARNGRSADGARQKQAALLACLAPLERAVHMQMMHAVDHNADFLLHVEALHADCASSVHGRILLEIPSTGISLDPILALREHSLNRREDLGHFPGASHVASSV
ncbi:hypothetical protein PFISCL1PPCAC_28176, partial [Pristionchus fissidentatus]